MKARCELCLHSVRVIRADSSKTARSCIEGDLIYLLQLSIRVYDLFTIENQSDHDEEVRDFFQAFAKIEDFSELQFDFEKYF